MTARAIARAIIAMTLITLTAACEGKPQSAPVTPTADSAPTPPADPTSAASGNAKTTAPEIRVTFMQQSGPIRVRLATAEAPRLSMAFILLAEKGYFNGRRWGDFSTVVRQLGESEPLFTVPLEFSPKLMHDRGGHLCASNTTDQHNARAKPNRIFLTTKEQERWNLVFSIFGVVETPIDGVVALKDGELMTEVTVEGDAGPLRSRFAREIASWSKAIDAAMAAQPATK